MVLLRIREYVNPCMMCGITNVNEFLSNFNDKCNLLNDIIGHSSPSIEQPYCKGSERFLVECVFCELKLEKMFFGRKLINESSATIKFELARTPQTDSTNFTPDHNVQIVYSCSLCKDSTCLYL